MGQRRPEKAHPLACPPHPSDSPPTPLERLTSLLRSWPERAEACAAKRHAAGGACRRNASPRSLHRHCRQRRRRPLIVITHLHRPAAGLALQELWGAELLGEAAQGARVDLGTPAVRAALFRLLLAEPGLEAVLSR